MRLFLIVLLHFVTAVSLAQVTEEKPVVETDSVPQVADPYYREDQFYASVAYNLLVNKPTGYSQNRFSTTLGGGFLRDIPLNKSRNHAVAIGLGYTYHNIKHNLKITETEDGAAYTIASTDDFDKNKLVLHYVDLPIEFRWRNSDSISHKFWRVYAGFRVSYLFSDKAVYQSSISETVKTKNNADLNKVMYSAYLSAGWNTWNLYACYGLNPLFKSAVLPGNDKIDLTSINLGLIFYIL